MLDDTRRQAELAEAKRRRFAALVELRSAATGVSPRTAAGYRKRARTLDKFTAAYGVASEGDPFLIAAFALASSRIGHKLKAVEANLTAIAWRYDNREVTRIARHTVARLRQENGEDPTSRAPSLPRGALLAMVRAAAVGITNSPMRELTTVRDVALLCVGVFGCLRPLELCLARIEHLVRHPDSYYLAIVGSKTNKDHRRTEGVWLMRRNDGLDPVGALDIYLAVLAAMGITEGPLFPGYSYIDDTRFGMGSHYLSQRLSAIADWAGLLPGISGYSLRRSGATLAHVSGVPAKDIAVLLRHRCLDSTAGYVDLILNEEDRAAWLSETVPDGWAPEVRRGRPILEWTKAGTLEDLVEEAAALAAEAILSVRPRTRSQYASAIAQWKTAAEKDGIDPERPLPEDFAMHLASKADKGVNPRTLKTDIYALEWWLALLGKPQPNVVAVAVAVREALIRSGRAAPVKRKSPQVTIANVVDLVNVPAVAYEWQLPAAALARALRVRLYVLDRIQAETAVFDGREATVVVSGREARLWPTGDALTDPVDALRSLVERRPIGPLLTPAEFVAIRSSIWNEAGCTWEPSRMTGDRWTEVVDQLARHVRSRLRLVAGVHLGLSGLLGLDEAVALRWEHLQRHSVGFVAKATAEHPLPPTLEGRLFLARSDALDLELALSRLAAVWPWRGDGLFDCRGPVLTNMAPADWCGDDPVPLCTSGWYQAVRAAGERVGVDATPLSLRVAGAHEDWSAHYDELRLQARMGHVFPSATRLFLKKHGLLGASATEPEEA